ncbi:MAG: PTS sugar transporter subunit IIB [Lachnospiraceae bacterium]|nr:PTS sugar transporter subunit IIB [Lachnospiraceae bacterium]MBQ9122277.1 PTS sugar transporter subunit IIB [Lachnospiraceae bacterium]
MKKVLLICAGGMSTGILMKKLIKFAQEQGTELQIDAVGLSSYEEVCEGYEVILLGPQVSYKKDEISQIVKKPIAVIAPYDYAIGNADNIMKQIDELYSNI